MSGAGAAAAAYAARGWLRFPPEPATRAWAAAVRALLPALLGDPGARWRHGGTWFVGVDALPNDPAGRVAGGPALAGAAVEAAARLCGIGWPALHRGQVSALRPGYPCRDPDEGEAAFAFRRDRAGAHVDGLLPAGPARERRLLEPHAFLLGIGITEAGPGAAPFTLWEGSHRILGPALARLLAPVPPARWGEVDLTQAYHAARRAALASCPRIALPLAPGEALLVHRHLLHGIGPWEEGAEAAPEGRVIVWFRPLCPRAGDWLALP